MRLREIALRSAVLNHTLFAIAALAAITLLVSIQPRPTLDFIGFAPEYNTLSCQGATSRNRVLSISTRDNALASEIRDTLCRDESVRIQYDDITVRWRHGVEQDLGFLSIVDVVAATDVPSAIRQTHRPVMGMPGYPVVILTRRVGSNLDCAYLSTASVGMLSSLQSRSGSQLLRGELARCRYSPGEWGPRARFYSRHEELRAALLRGEVDVIGTYWRPGLDENLFESYGVHHVDAAVTGMQWWVAQQLLDSSVHCVLEQLVRSRAESSDDVYWSNLVITRQCRGGAQ